MTTLPSLAISNPPVAISAGDLLLMRQTGKTVDTAIEMADLRLAVQENTKAVYATDYGAKFDGIHLKDVTTTNANPVVSSVVYDFVSSDVGKAYTLKASGTSTTYMTRGTILSVDGSGNATLSANSTSSVAGTAQIYFGTDDTTAIQAAIDVVNPEDDPLSAAAWQYRYKGVVIFPKGMSMITRELVLRTGVSFKGQGKYVTWLKWASTNTMAVTGYNAMFYGGLGNNSSQLYVDNQFRDFRIDMSAAFTTTYSYHAKCIEIVYILRPVFMGLFLDSSPATSIGVDYAVNLIACDNYFYRPGRLWVSGSGGGSGLDFQTQAAEMFNSDNILLTDPQTSIISRNVFIDPMVSAVRCTNDDVIQGTSRTIISNNIVQSKLTTGKGLEDCSNTGAIIIGNTISNTSAGQTSEGPIGTEGQHIWCGIITTGGKDGVIIGNTITGPYHDGIRLNRFERTSSTLTPLNYLVANNVINGAYRNGIRVNINSTYTMKNVSITGNVVTLSGGAGLAITNSGTGGDVKNLMVNNNLIYDNAATTATDALKSGVYINTTLTGLMMAGNYIYDSGVATQKYGITVDTVVASDAFLTANHISGNTTSPINLVSGGTFTGDKVVNKGLPSVFTKQQNFGAAALTSTSAHIAWNLDNAQFASHTMTENTTLDIPTNMVDGGTYILRLTQHASSPKTLTLASGYRTAGGVGFTISATNSAVDYLTFVCDGTHMDLVGSKAFA